MYGKHFAQTYTGSMVGSGSPVFAVWGYIIAHLKVSDSSIELNPIILSTIIGDPVDVIESALEKLCSPDPRSRTKDFEGRRLIREGEYLYRVVNAEKYNGFKDDNARRAYQREYMRGYRKGERKTNVKTVNLTVNSREQNVSNTEADTDTDTKALSADGVLFDNSLEQNKKPLRKISKNPRPRKNNEEKSQKNGYNPVTLWIMAIGGFCKIPSPKVTGYETKLLTELGNIYPEREFRAMLRAYGRDHEENGKPWKLFEEFYKCHSHWRSKARVGIDPGSEEALRHVLAGGDISELDINGSGGGNQESDGSARGIPS